MLNISGEEKVAKKNFSKALVYGVAGEEWPITRCKCKNI